MEDADFPVLNLKGRHPLKSLCSQIDFPYTEISKQDGFFLNILKCRLERPSQWPENVRRICQPTLKCCSYLDFHHHFVYEANTGCYYPRIVCRLVTVFEV